MFNLYCLFEQLIYIYVKLEKTASSVKHYKYLYLITVHTIYRKDLFMPVYTN